MKELIVLERAHAVLLVFFLALLFATVGWLVSDLAPVALRLLSAKKAEKELPLKKRIEILENKITVLEEKSSELQHTLNTVFLNQRRR